MLALEGVSRRFPNGTEALRDVGFTLGEGEFLALLGPSGCGKSTLLRLIAGLDQPDAGRIAWSPLPPRPGEIAMVFQDPNLLPWADAADNAALPLRLAGSARAPARERALRALAQVGLPDGGGLYPRELSGGMRMRVSLARALAARPRVLLMDEPFAALDEFTRHALQEDLRALQRQTGMTILFVTHSIDEAAYLARRILLMRARPGRIAEERVSPAADADRADPARLGFVAALSRDLSALSAA